MSRIKEYKIVNEHNEFYIKKCVYYKILIFKLFNKESYIMSEEIYDMPWYGSYRVRLNFENIKCAEKYISKL